MRNEYYSDPVIDLLLRKGWDIDRTKADRLYLTRPGKKKGTSATYFIESNYLYNFSDNSPIAATGLFANQIFEFYNEPVPEQFQFKKNPSKNQQKKKKKEKFTIDTSEYKLYNEYGDRVYRVMVNQLIIDKNINPNTGEVFTWQDKSGVIHQDLKYATHFNSRRLMTIDKLINHIGSGKMFVPAVFKPADYYPNGLWKVIPEANYYKNGYCTLDKRLFESAEIFAIDIDNKIKDRKRTTAEGYVSIDDALDHPQTQYALFMYTTASHAGDWHKFRMVFALPFLITDPKLYTSIVDKYIAMYNADTKCSNVNRLYYGSSNALVYDFTNGDLIRFINGNRMDL